MVDEGHVEVVDIGKAEGDIEVDVVVVTENRRKEDQEERRVRYCETKPKPLPSRNTL